jgi:hypothetical protein
VTATDQSAPDRSNGYAIITSAFVLGAVIVGAAAKLRKGPLPKRVPVRDIVLFGLATHKAARLVSKDRVLMWLRAPVASAEHDEGPSEVASRPRGKGVRRAIGELVTCPFCMGQWIAAAFIAAFVFVPRAARIVAAMFAARAVADFLQFGYTWAEQAAENEAAS